jgi:3-phenylpropionate/trans-cinnamate dioxygenase ferredoxin reductase subunit
VIAIIGAGCAGWSAAIALREYGYDGEVRLFGAESLPAYERPALSKAFLSTPDLQLPPPLEPGATTRSAVGLELGTRVVAIDPAKHSIQTSNGGVPVYSKLLLATGAEPRRLAIPGSRLEGIHYLRELSDARALRAQLTPGRRVAIIGGGVIGLEVASSARSRGCDVTVVELASQLMARVVPAELASHVEAFHRSNGVSVLSSVRPVALAAAGAGVAGVILEGGAMVPADVVVVGIGASPRSKLAQAAGLPVDDGVIVDERFASSDARIFAAGDVARVFHQAEQRSIRLEQWQPAWDQGRAAAAAMLDRGVAYRDTPWMWSDQGELHLQAAGFGFGHAEVVVRGDLHDHAGVACLGVRDGRMVAVAGASIGTGVARTIRAARTLIEHRVPIDAQTLRAPDLDLRRFARSVAAASAEDPAGSPDGCAGSGVERAASAR